MKRSTRIGGLAAAFVIGLLGALPGAASGAVTVGEAFDASPGGGCTNGVLPIQTTSPGNQYVVPSAGVLTSWSFFSTDQPQTKFKVARPTGTPNQFLIVGESDQKVPVPGLNTFTDISIDVQAGDVIGLFSPAGGEWCVLDGSYAVHQAGSDLAPGATATFASNNGVKLNIAASLEADCDGDSLGDETEDGDTASCTPLDPPIEGDTTPPDTTIASGPSGKVKSKSATFGFSGSDTRVVASFQCKLDSGSFETCTSPKSYSGLKKGSHTFSVRAVDAAGNVDPTPATRTWKVKKKKKKK